ncbi:MAG: porin [Rhodocyclales bacterium]|nr:porin [Rhodocyclales bacterium]
MQKKLIALAIAGLSGAAFAQSNVTISGAMELHLESISASGATAAGADHTSRTRVTNNTSWVRLSGAEKIGDLTAVFQIEQDVNGDTGAATGWASRNSFVGLAGGFGTAIAGRHDVHYTSHMAGGVDFGSAGALPHAANSMNLIGQVTGLTGAGLSNLIGGRLDNVIAYIAPSFGGLTVQLGYTTGAEATTAALGAKDSAWNLFATYKNGPVNAFWSHTDTNNGNGATRVAGLEVVADRLGIAYTFGAVKVGLINDNTKADLNGALAAKRNAWSLPISYTSGANSLYFAYAKAGTVTGALGGANTGATNTILGYTYALSKRTQLGASWSRISNDAGAAYDFWARGVSAGGAATVNAGTDPTSFAVGVNHSF